MPDIDKELLQVRYIPDPILRMPTHEIPEAEIQSPEFRELIKKMFTTMKHSRGVGLAAPQVGLSKQVFIVNDEGQKFVVINPEITKVSRQMKIAPEGCLSIPGQEFDIERHKRITIEYFDLDANRCKIKLRGFLATVFQHEYDHLDGILITDRYLQQQTDLS